MAEVWVIFLCLLIQSAWSFFDRVFQTTLFLDTRSMLMPLQGSQIVTLFFFQEPALEIFQHLFVVCLQIILFPYEWNINTSRNLNELFVVRYVTVIAFLFLSRCQVLWINTVHRWNIWYLQNIIWILSRSEKWSKIFGSVRCNLDVLQWPMDRKWIVWMGCFMGKLHAQLCLLVGGFKRQA